MYGTSSLLQILAMAIALVAGLAAVVRLLKQKPSAMRPKDR